MKNLLIIPLVWLLSSCGRTDSRFIRKRIADDDMVIDWYFYSYITNTSPDIIEVEKNGKRIEIYRATSVITDVILKRNLIIIRVVEPAKERVQTRKVEDSIFGRKIVLDTTGTYNELGFIPRGIKE